MEPTNFCENCGEPLGDDFHRYQDDNYIALVCKKCYEKLEKENK